MQPGGATATGEPVPKGERTRRLILDAAEQLFAERGFTGTTFAAIAERVGIQQPGVFYYFKKKAALYDAVIEEALGALEAEVLAALEGPASARDRVLAAVGAWVDAIAERPTLAHLILHEAATPDAGEMPEAFRAAGAPLARGIFAALEEHRSASIDATDALHFASAMSGTTLFFVAAMSRMIGVDAELEQATMKRHKALVLTTARTLMQRLRDDA